MNCQSVSGSMDISTTYSISLGCLLYCKQFFAWVCSSHFFVARCSSLLYNPWLLDSVTAVVCLHVSLRGHDRRPWETTAQPAARIISGQTVGQVEHDHDTYECSFTKEVLVHISLVGQS